MRNMSVVQTCCNCHVKIDQQIAKCKTHNIIFVLQQLTNKAVYRGKEDDFINPSITASTYAHLDVEQYRTEQQTLVSQPLNCWGIDVQESKADRLLIVRISRDRTALRGGKERAVWAVRFINKFTQPHFF